MCRSKEGKDKWISRYVALKKALHAMENTTRIDRLEAACEVYKQDHKEMENHSDEDREDNEEGEEGEESEEGKTDGSDSDEDSTTRDSEE